MQHTGCAGVPQLDVAPAVASIEWSDNVTGGADRTDVASVDDQRTDLADLLGSAALAELIARARMTSPGLLRATAQVDQARALVRVARGASLPSLSIGSSAVGSRRAGGAFDFSGNFATIEAAYSVDFAGRADAGKRSAARRAEAARDDRAALEISLTAEIARTYVSRATLQARVDLIDQSIAQAAQLQKIIELRQREGVATSVDVGLQAIRVQQLQAERERLRQSLDQTRVALSLLVGEEAPQFRSVPADIAQFAIPTIVPPSPARLIAIRPDVRAAEARIAAAGGDITQARAAFFPQFQLSIGRGAQSVLSGGLLSTVGIAADLLAPIFNRARLKGNLDYSAARQRESVQSYREVLLTALAEVENGLSTARFAQSRAVILAAITSEARRTAALARVQYLEGEADLRHLLDAQDLLIDAQDAELVSRQERLEAAIALYRVTQG